MIVEQFKIACKVASMVIQKIAKQNKKIVQHCQQTGMTMIETTIVKKLAN